MSAISRPALLVLAVALGAALVGCSSGGADGTGPTGTAAPSAQPGPAPPPGAVGPPAIGISTQPAVPVGSPGAFSDVKLVATVTKIDPVQVGATGPGEIAGTGLAATVRFSNESGKPVDLDGAVVNASYGNGVPAISSAEQPAAPASGALPPGQSRSGVYVFTMPERERETVTIEVNYSGSADVVLIRR